VIPNAEGVQYKASGLVTQGGLCALKHDWFAITKRVVSYDGITPAEEDDFSYITNWPATPSYQWTSKVTTVTTKDLIRGTSFNTVYTYLPATPPQESFYNWENLGYVPVESTIAYYADTVGTLLKTITKKWATINLLSAQCETLPNGQTSGVFYQYAGYAPFASVLTYTPAANFTNLPLDVAEYDYGAVASTCVQPVAGILPIRETVTAYQGFGNTPLFGYASLQDRPATVKVYGVANNTKTLMQETDYAYDGTSPTNVSPTPYGHDETNYGSSSTAPRGNPTTVIKKCFVGTVSCTDSVTHYTYDTTGQVLSSTDPGGNTTNYSYTDNYTTDAGSPSQNTNAYVTTATEPTTNGVSHITTFKYGFNDGMLRSKTDENSQVTKFCYWTTGCSGTIFDPFLRLTNIQNPDSGQTNVTYNDAGPTPTVTTSKTVTASSNLVNTTTYDGMGHSIQTALSSDPDGVIYTATTYDGLARPYKTYNPTRCNPPTTNCGSETTWGFTTYIYDALGRTTNVAEPDGSATQTSYSNNQTTVTDEAGKQRTSQKDALGRLTSVWEVPNVSGYNYQTQYQYDALGNMICAVQKGTDTTAFSSCASASAAWRPRSFAYDSLSRLLTATNPESGTITYTYDANASCTTPNSFTGQLVSKTDARGIRACMRYDALNRITQKNYSDTTPTARYGYDGSAITGCTTTPPTLSDANPKGYRTSMCDGSGATSWNHDVTGRMLSEKRTILGSSAVTKTIAYTYNLDGSTATLTYPAGRIITYQLKTGGTCGTGTCTAGRFQTAIDAVNSINYVTAATYTPQGSISGLMLGTAIQGKQTYNSRLQPLQLFYTTGTVGSDSQLQQTTCPTTIGNLMHRIYNFGAGTSDNGNVNSITNCRDTNRTQNFTYDVLNRIQQGNSTGTNWGETFTIDPWGNLTNRTPIVGKTNPNYVLLNAAPATTQNRLPGFGYDVAGNMTTSGSTTYTYDAESRLTATAGVTYAYDGDGNRVKKSNGTLYWTSGGSDILTETDLAGTSIADYIFFNGNRVARVDQPSGNKHFYISEHLGSATVVTNNTGAIQDESDYYPYGGEMTITDTDSNKYKFTGKERDSESGLDEFGARYYASSLGRFMIPDWAEKPTSVPYASFGNPQSLNLYSYVNNNPTTTRDPDGHETQDTLDPQAAQEAGNTFAGALTGLARMAVGTWNTAADLLNAQTGYGLQTLPMPQYENRDQAIAGAAAQLGTVVYSAVEGATTGSAARGAEAGVPDANVVVRGGQGEMPASGTYSGAHGATLEEAASGVPHGTIRSSTAGAVRESGGSVVSKPEPAYPGGPMNERHVNVTGGQKTFGPPKPNPVPRSQRVPSAPKPKKPNEQ
jgi:RHS repeat-associated protein